MGLTISGSKKTLQVTLSGKFQIKLFLTQDQQQPHHLELIRNANSLPHTRPEESEALGLQPRHLCFK